jgi:Uma2 family endonuclease
MVTQLSQSIDYPESDGKPMADNTKQFRWIVVVKENLERLFANDPNVFVAGDLLWYPLEGNNKICTAPDAMVVFGRPKGDRGSYKQWEEDNLPPQVVFEILSPCNRSSEMGRKLLFYDRYGVEEYYLYDPERDKLLGWIRQDEFLSEIEDITNWVSPKLQIRFDTTAKPLQIYRPDGDRFLNFIELDELLQQERQRTEQERQRAEQERQRAEQERQRAERLAERLREMGIDPDEI